MRKETPISIEEYDGDEPRVDTKDVQKEIEKYKRMQKIMEDKHRFKNDTLICCVAIVSLAGIETMAIYKGIDGKYLSLIVLAVATIAGFKAKDIYYSFMGKK
jgi:hypothetical protein